MENGPLFCLLMGKNDPQIQNPGLKLSTDKKTVQAPRF